MHKGKVEVLNPAWTYAASQPDIFPSRSSGDKPGEGTGPGNDGETDIGNQF
jgi:hypothetical protein